MLVENLHALLFCVPVSSFDQWLKEDAKINTLEDSISLWDSVVSNKLLQHVDITVLFTKVDILKGKYVSHGLALDVNATGANDIFRSIALEKLAAGVLFKQFVYSYGDRPNDYKTVTDCEEKLIFLFPLRT
ncbi:hypothetical protein H0H93_000367 [Arthromyces matolae]|nr:hypothetical protein H0H93_000367 [Arthromyces matolae]